MDLKFESSHVENTANCNIHKSNENSAANAATSEHELTFLQALRYYRTAVMWSILVSTATVMESYDLQLINSFFAYPEFQKKYGVRLPNGSYSIPAKWQLGLSLGSNIGLFIGVFLNGWLTEYFGPRKVMLGCYVILSGFIFVTFFAPTVEVLLVSQILCGLPWGIFAALTPSYAAEVCPMVLRSYLTTFINLCWVIGHIIATGVLQGLINNNTEWDFRIPFALQWMWPLPLFVIIWFAPDSPWWLVRRNRMQEAEATMRRLITAPEEFINPKDMVAMIVHTINTEKEMNIGTTYAQCFQGNSRRRTEIAMVSWGGQLLVGFAIQNYTTYFFTLAGLATADAFKLSLGMYSTAFLGTVFSWFIQAYFGRRRMYLTGLSVMLPIMALVGFLDLAPASTNIRWTQSAVLLIWFACYGLSIGPLPYAIASEVPASRLRIKTISLGRNSYYFLSCVNIVAAPYLLSPSEANLRGKAAFPAALFTLLLLVWAWFRLPETKGRTFEELDILFERQVSTRQFATHDTNLVD